MKAVSLHAWAYPISIAYVPRVQTPALEQTTRALFEWLRGVGCTITERPANDTDLVITTARFGRTVTREEALLFHGKRRYQLSRRPTILTIVDIPEDEYQGWLAHFGDLARLPEAEAARSQYPGLGPQAAEVIAHQARRGGPELAMARFLQAQLISIRVMALRTVADRPFRAVHYDLAGARPVSEAADLEAFATDAGPRLLAAVCAREVNRHVYAPAPLPRAVWEALEGPEAMVRAGLTFTDYGFFTTPIYVEKLLGYRGISDAISAQFSEGCYAVYEADIPGLITTATGSARLVDKRSITRADQAVVTGLTPAGDGAVVWPVAGMEMVVPSVEAVEMLSLCRAVPGHARVNTRGDRVEVPNARAILHGHLGVERYDPRRVEAVMLDPLYYTQLVSCGTGPLAAGTADAFARSQALRDLSDPRQVVFLEQPGHGVMVVEKWPAPGDGRPPFETIREYLAAGHLQMTFDIAQGPVDWEARIAAGQALWRQRVLEPSSQVERV
jgi:hypothetical protein